MALEPITRQEKIIAGQDLTPITRMEKFLKQYGGGSGGVTSWNDLTDKPFGDNADGTAYPMSGKYVEGMGYVESTKTVIAEESELIYVGEQYGLSVFQLPIYDSIFEDLEAAYDDYSLRIVWDGVEYNPSRYGKGSSKRLGNESILAEGEPDTGEPFTVSLGDGWFLTKSTEATHTVAIYTATETIHPIDQKFLPSAFVVNFATTDMQNWTADKTADEIAAAVNAGKEVYGSVMGMKVDLIGVTPNGYVTFGRIFPDAANLMSYHFGVTTDNSVQATMASLQMTPMG